MPEHEPVTKTCPKKDKVGIPRERSVKTVSHTCMREIESKDGHERVSS